MKKKKKKKFWHLRTVEDPIPKQIPISQYALVGEFDLLFFIIIINYYYYYHQNFFIFIFFWGMHVNQPKNEPVESTENNEHQLLSSHLIM